MRLMPRNPERSSGVAGCLVYFALLTCFTVVPMTLVSFWTDRNLEFWLTHFKGEEVIVPHILSWICSIPWPVAIIVNTLAEICKLAL